MSEGVEIPVLASASPRPSASGPQPEARFQAVDRKQMLWRPVDVERLVEPDHLVRAIWELVGQLDLSGFIAAVKSVEGAAGRPAIDPREEDASRRPEGSGRERAAREKVEKLEHALEEMHKVQAAPQARAEKQERRASETDPQARVMKQNDGGFAPSHNVQLSTDTAHGIIVGVGVTQAANDQQQLAPALEQIQRQTGRLPDQILVDDGYTTRENILEAAERGVDLIGSETPLQGDPEAGTRNLQKRGMDPAFHSQHFRYDAAGNTYTCPAGKTLPYQTTKHDRVGVERKVYQARAADCRPCAFRPQCSPGRHGRRLVRSENVPEVTAYREKMQTEAARAAYRWRAPVAEFTNAWLKVKLGLRQFCVRGLKKARCEILWAALTYNMQQWFRLRWKVRLSGATA